MTLQNKWRRSIGKNLSFYLTGSVLTAITVMLLVGAFSVSDSIYACFGQYFQDTRIEDGQFTTQTEIPADRIQALEQQYDVVLEQQCYLNLSREDTRFRVFAATQKLNRHTVTEGRDLQTDSDILVTYKYAKANHISVGDTLDIAGETFTVCGLGMKPDYAVMLYDFTESIADKEGFGIGIVTRTAFEKLGAATQYYSVRYEDAAQEEAFRRSVYEQYGTQEYIEQKANTRIRLMFDEADALVAEFSLYSPIIMIIVVAVIAMVLARTVRREGRTIGTLMAMGYRKSELVRHYLLYGMVPAVGGDILGIIFSIPFARAFCAFYFGDVDYIAYTVEIPWKLMAVALMVPIVVYGLVSWLVLNRLLQSEIVPLLKEQHRQKTSAILNGSSAGLAFIYNIRSIFLNGFRSITLVIGIAIATLCIVLGGSFADAYENLLEEKVPYAMLGGQYEYGFNTYQSENPYGKDAVFDVSFGASVDDSRFNLIGYAQENDILQMQTEEGKDLEYGQYYMSGAAAKLYDIQAGDSFSFYNTVTLEETTVVISGIIRNDILSLVLTSRENVADLLGREADEYNVIISREKLDIPQELLRKTASLEDYRQMVANLSATSGIVLRLLKVLGILICLLIVTMMSGMIVEESSRNISMLKILGYRAGEVRSFVLTSNHLLVPVGFLLGVPLGYLTAYSMILSSAASSGMFMSLPVKASTILESAAFVLIGYVLAMLLQFIDHGRFS